MMWKIGEGGGESPHAGDAILARQVQIQQRDVGRLGGDQGDRARDGLGRADHANVRLRTEHRGHAVVDDRMIVDEQDANQ